MKPIATILEKRISDVMAGVVGQPGPAVVKPTQDPQFGDYQVNGVMGLAKKLKTNPRELAQQIVEKLDVSDICETPEIAGPGFINLRLKTVWLEERLLEALPDEQRVGIEPQADPPVTVVDFSAPNIAKQMHVGHLRSTIIGDVIARILEFWYGDAAKVIRQNHVGDWGTQFGMLITQLRRYPDAIHEDETSIADLEALYREAKVNFDNDAAFRDEAYQAVVALHNGDADTLNAWKRIVEKSLLYCDDIYRQLHVELDDSHVRGESFYNDRLPDVISGLDAGGMLTKSDGAQCVFMDAFKNKDGEPLPMIVQKSDGAYLYATTDLAALRFRVNELGAKRLIYVTDARQKLHFDMLFTCVRQAGWADESVRLDHVPFGTVLGPDNRPLKTRSGENIKLKDLLNEAEVRARKIVEEKNPELDDAAKADVAQAVGIGAVKYADLSNNLVSDYVFDWNRMLAMEGNTAPYLQYAFARIRSIFRKGEVDRDDLLASGHTIKLSQSEEAALAKLLLRYSEVLESVVRDLRPHLLTNYLFDLAQAFSGFYTNCPVLKADEPVRAGRLLLCDLTARTIRHGLHLLGIKTIEQM